VRLVPRSCRGRDLHSVRWPGSAWSCPPVCALACLPGDVLQNVAEIGLRLLHGIHDKAINRRRGQLSAYPLGIIPPDLMSPGNAAYPTSNPGAMNDLIGTDAFDHVQPCPETIRFLLPEHELAITGHVINDSALIEHQLPGDQRRNSPNHAARY
jgi:hypothetical protein